MRKLVSPLFCVVVCAAMLLGAGDVMVDLDSAKKVHGDELLKADESLLAALDQQIKADANTGKFDEAQALISQREQFKKSHAMPSAASIADAVASYRSRVRSSDARLSAAYDEAITAANKSLNIQQASALRRERDQLLHAGNAAMPQTPSSDDAVFTKLQQAKTEYDKSIQEARQKVQGTIESRLKQATSQGDLKKVEELQSASAAFQSNDKVGDDVRDATVRGAIVQRDGTVKTAHARLLRAYDDAIREYTRGGQISRAEAVKADREKFAGAQSADTEAPDTVSRAFDHLGGRSGVPGYLVFVSRGLGDKDGLHFPKNEAVARTKQGTFLKEDFIFDLVVSMKRGSEPKVAYFGIGEGSFEGGYAQPQKSVNFRINSPDAAGGSVELVTNGFGNVNKLCKLSNPGTHLFRIEKRGDTVTFAVCEDFKGQFKADVSKTVADIREYAPFLDEHNTFIFFGGGGTFSQVRLVHLPKKT